MKTVSTNRFWAPYLMLSAVFLSPDPLGVQAQTPALSPSQTIPSVPQSLLDKAHALEIRGRLDMASQAWQQVLLADPNNREALGGLARAAKLSGNLPLASMYIERLRAIDPNDPGIARAESAQVQQDHAIQLQQAGKLAQAGQYAQAMGIYRQVYGEIPPPGEPSLAYYETEAATEEGRPHAIAGLRKMSEQFPGDARYQIALGRILTYNPKTREEGRNYLSKFPDDPQAVEGLRQSLLWDAQNPASAGDIRKYLSRHQDVQLSTILRNQPKAAAPAKALTPDQRAAQAVLRARTAEEQAAYRALNAKHLDEAEQRFKAILAEHPEAPNALAGMGYVRMQQANFGGAISFLVQAKQDGARDPGLDAAISTSRFWYTMSQGADALAANDLPTAEKTYRAALTIRPNSPEGLQALGGTLLKAQQPEPAIPVFTQFVKIKPADPAAWRGLFTAQDNAGQIPQALQTDRRVPAAVHAKLMKDPEYLRVLASAYTSAGRDSDAQRVLRVALDLPFPADAKGLQAETQMQYASLLQQANRLDQAGGLYRQVLAQDQKNVTAWQGLVRVEHAMAQDQQAVQTLETMPPEVYEAAMRDPGFETTVASIYQVQGKLDVAQNLLEKAIAQQTADGQKPSVPIQLQLAGIYLERNNAQQAYPIYQQILSENPDRLDAWKGLLNALHSTGHDQEALAQIQQIPTPIRAQLENDVDFLQVAGAVYNSLGQPKQAAIFLNRVKQHYVAINAAPPADVDIQNAWLLYNGGNDAGLYRQLMSIGGRPDLNIAQRQTVQTIWTNWAVRRANQAAAAGKYQRSLAILNAAAHAFPDNPAVIKALAGGYARAGLHKQAVAIWKAQNLTAAPAADYKSAVGSALAADDLKDAETWLRFGLDQYPKDAEMLSLAAKFEAARGDTNRAAVYYRASLDAMPPDDPGAALAAELSHPVPAAATALPSATQSQDLAGLLKPGMDDTSTASTMAPAPAEPYLPSYGNATGQAPVVPSYMANPASRPQNQTPTSRTRLRDYVPQASLEEPVPMDGTEQPTVDVAADSSPTLAPDSDGTTLVYSPVVYQQQQIARVTGAIAELAQVQDTPPLQIQQTGPLTSTPQGTRPAATPAQSGNDIYGPYIPYQAPSSMAADVNPGTTSVQLGQNIPHTPPPQPDLTDVLPTARYMPNARVAVPAASHPDIAAANAAAIRRRQSNPNALSGVSRPPSDDYTNAPMRETQYTGQPYNPSAQTTGASDGQTTQPRRGSLPAAATTQSVPVQTGDSSAQQYPQPNTSYTPSTTTAPRLRSRRPAAPAAAVAPAPTGPSLSYPGVAQPLGTQPLPLPGSPYPLGPAPSDADLVAKRVPPLRNYSESLLQPAVPLSPREQTERDLETLEASYSGWIGGTASGRYRSGTAGIDRLTDLESPVEASVVLNNTVRLTVVPRAVFLSSGAFLVSNYSGSTPINSPTLGTLNAANAAAAGTTPNQQFSSGVGGELQIATRLFSASAGYTPYNFLVQNIIGHASYKPVSHLTLSFDRDSVTETQLSYAGLHDPGQASAVTDGPVWGGVVATGGGIRFDFGDEKAGFYIAGDGADLTGYHVLDNYKFEGSAGAYFLVHNWPRYGKLNIGASLFGMHYQYNERGETYGLGGYFSPSAYFLAAVPVTYTGHYRDSFHYSVSGSVGVQTFQEASQIYFPLDPALETSFRSGANGGTTPCTIPQISSHTCGESGVNSNTGFNYSIDSEAAYRVSDHWYVGGFFSGNNTNNYNTVSGGFFVRYLFRPQYPTENYPTGMFKPSGFRALRVP